jgi:hypothetical protein
MATEPTTNPANSEDRRLQELLERRPSAKTCEFCFARPASTTRPWTGELRSACAACAAFLAT